MFLQIDDIFVGLVIIVFVLVMLCIFLLRKIVMLKRTMVLNNYDELMAIIDLLRCLAEYECEYNPGSGGCPAVLPWEEWCGPCRAVSIVAQLEMRNNN